MIALVHRFALLGRPSPVGDMPRRRGSAGVARRVASLPSPAVRRWTGNADVVEMPARFA